MAPPFLFPEPRRFDPLSYLLANAARRPDAPAVFDAGREVTFQELADVVVGLAKYFREDGLGEGQAVAVHLPNRWEYVALELAIPAAGGVIMPLPLTLGEAEKRWAMERSGATRLLSEADLPPLFAGLAPVGPAPASNLPSHPERIVEIALTSGTTGMPKLASLSAKLKQATFEGFTSRLEVTEADRVLVMSPLPRALAECASSASAWERA